MTFEEAGKHQGPIHFDKYRMLGKIGQGGMGTVYLVEDESGKRHALKALSGKGVTSGDYIHRFMRETRLALALKHPSIVVTTDTGHASDGTLFIVSEFCSGGNLAQWLDDDGPIDARLAIYWMWGIASALEYVWREHRMIHRDIKPANLLLDAGLKVKLADLGLAKRLTSNATHLTKEGTSLGSVKYTSPEQAQASEDMDCRSDMYSLGATFYHLITGKPMFERDTAAATLMDHVVTEPTPLAAFRPDIPSSLAKLIHKLIAKEPDERPSDAEVLINELEALAVSIDLDIDNFTPKRSNAGAGHEAFMSEELATSPDAGGVSVQTEMLPRGGHIVALKRVGETPRPWPGSRARLRMTHGTSGRSWDVALYAAFPVRFGRAMNESVDMTIRIYPVEEHTEECMKVSSIHGEFNATRDWWTVMDSASRNGMKLDGSNCPASMHMELRSKCIVNLSSAVALQCYALPRLLGNLVAFDEAVVTTSLSSALVITRLENRPELAYVLIREGLMIGGSDPSQALVLPGMEADYSGTLWWYEGRFYWQNPDTDELMAQTPGAQWEVGPVRFELDCFSYDMFK